MTISNIKQLNSTDHSRLTTFLNHYPDETVFLRYNLLRGGLNYSGKPGQSVFIASLHDEEIKGVISLTWNGHIQLYAPQDLNLLCSALISFLIHSKRNVVGINGVSRFVREAMTHINLDQKLKQLDCDETLFRLKLSKLQIPALLNNPDLSIRRPVEDDFDILVEWQLEYAIEALGADKSEELITQTQKRVKNLVRHAGKDTRILINKNIPVSRTNFTASLPDYVMIGGVWTPAEQRNKGYARAVVAAHLMEARELGVTNATLFTVSPAAAKAYEAIGFEEIGNYSLVLLQDPWSPEEA